MRRRLLAVGFGSRAEAQAACDTLKRQGQGCIVQCGTFSVTLQGTIDARGGLGGENFLSGPLFHGHNRAGDGANGLYRIEAPAPINTPSPIFGWRSSSSLPVPPSVTECSMETLSPTTAVSPMTMEWA